MHLRVTYFVRVVVSQTLNRNNIVFISLYDINKKINNGYVGVRDAETPGQQIADNL